MLTAAKQHLTNQRDAFDNNMKETVVGLTEKGNQIKFVQFMANMPQTLDLSAFDPATTEIACRDIVNQVSVPGIGFFKDPIAFFLIAKVFQAKWYAKQTNQPNVTDIYDWFKELKAKW